MGACFSVQRKDCGHVRTTRKNVKQVCANCNHLCHEDNHFGCHGSTGQRKYVKTPEYYVLARGSGVCTTCRHRCHCPEYAVKSLFCVFYCCFLSAQAVDLLCAKQVVTSTASIIRKR